MQWHGERIQVETEPSSFDASLMATTMDYQLTLDKILANAEVVHGAQQIVTCRPDGRLSRCAFRDLAVRSRKLASALIAAGLKPGDRVASLMWNNSAHLEAYYGVPMAGGILHTVNVRFHPEEIAYVIRDAESRFLIVDDVLLPLWREASSNCSLKEVIVHDFSGDGHAGLDYEEFLAPETHAALPALECERPVQPCATRVARQADRRAWSIPIEHSFCTPYAR